MFTDTEDKRCVQQSAVGDRQATDRGGDFDQTAQHVHMPASTCPVPDCKDWPPAEKWTSVIERRAKELEGENAAMRRRLECFEKMDGSLLPVHVSPAIWEYRVRQLQHDLDAERKENAILRQNVATLKARIAGHERLAAGLAKYVDKAEAMFAEITGTTPLDFVSMHGNATDDREAAA